MNLKQRMMAWVLSAAMLIAPSLSVAEEWVAPAGEVTLTAISDDYVGGEQINLSAGIGMSTAMSGEELAAVLGTDVETAEKKLAAIQSLLEKCELQMSFYDDFGTARIHGDLTLDGQQVDFSFENIRVFGLDGSEQVIEGLWTASLTLDIPDMSLTLHPSVDGLTFYGDKLDKNEDVEPNKIQANSCMVELSPMSVRLTLTYDRPANVKDAYYDPADKITLILADGTRLENYSYGSQIAYDADTSVPGTETARIMGLFHQAFNPEDVVAIEYAGARIELK
jgi:hypothetical protein